MKKLYSILVALTCFGIALPAQSRQEKKWYDKTISTGTVAAYDNFIKRYPKSVFRHEIDSLRFDALYVTHMDNYEAMDIITTLVPHLKQQSNRPDFFKAAAYRDEGRDFILGVSVREDDLPFDSLRFYLCEKENGVWQMPQVSSIAKYVYESNKTASILIGDETIVTIDGADWLHFSYRNYSDDAERIEHVESLIPIGAYALDNQVPGAVSSAFAGSRLSGQRIEGLLTNDLSGEKDIHGWEKYLNDKLLANESLVRIAESDLLTDQAIEWWLTNNPSSQTSAKSLKFGVLDEKCSIVKSYKSCRTKETSGGWTAALFDIRGYTVICAKNSSGKYSLVWCEPRFKNRSSDQILNTIYFEKGSTLALFYYQGRKAFKYKVNLSSKAISR